MTHAVVSGPLREWSVNSSGEMVMDGVQWGTERLALKTWYRLEISGDRMKLYEGCKLGYSTDRRPRVEDRRAMRVQSQMRRAARRKVKRDRSPA